MQRFLKGDHDVCFHIGPSLGCRTAPAEPTECGSAASAAKKRFEEIAEASPIKLELDAAPALASPLIRAAAGLLTLPLRPGLETAWPVPIGPKLIIFLPLLRIAQDLVRFIDLLKFFFGKLFILGHIRVVLARQLAKSAANFLLIRGLRHAECLVIVSKLNWHLLSSLCLRLNRATFSMMRELGKFIVIIGQAPGPREPTLKRPFAHTAGRTLFRWFEQFCGMNEAAVRSKIYFAAVCRCFPGKNSSGTDRVPAPDEIRNCASWMDDEIQILRPHLIIPTGRLAIMQFIDCAKLEDVIGRKFRA